MELDVLLVEDDATDALLFKEALAQSRGLLRVSVAESGPEALERVRNKRPQLVLLDLQLPGKDGFGVLSEIRREEALRLIPVLILTTSSAPVDVRRAYQLGANGYLVKPASWSELCELVRALEDCWVRFGRPPVT
jgi:two-component system, chemotaxis family, response regulator Rcp1